MKINKKILNNVINIKSELGMVRLNTKEIVRMLNVLHSDICRLNNTLNKTNKI